MLIPFDYLFKKYAIKVPGVLHLGANVGQEAEAYVKQAIPKVVWVEALPDLHFRLHQNVDHLPGHIALLACVTDKDGDTVTFNVASNGGQSSSILPFGTHSIEHPSVHYVAKHVLQTIRVDTLLRNNRIEIKGGWFLNADLQGAELMALRGMGSLLWEFDYAYIEVNTRELYKGCPRVEEIDAYLVKFGFVGRETKMTGNGWGDKFYSRAEIMRA